MPKYADHSKAVPILRHTKQGAVIEEVLAGADRPITAEEVLARGQAREPGLGIATVHRQLKKLVTNHIASRVEIPGEAPRFELAQKGCHQHFKCEECGTVLDVEEQVSPKPMLPKGFKVRDHQTVIYGECQQCAH
jgi:Fur family ferric uptake transcriptional regulator